MAIPTKAGGFMGGLQSGYGFADQIFDDVEQAKTSKQNRQIQLEQNRRADDQNRRAETAQQFTIMKETKERDLLAVTAIRDTLEIMNPAQRELAMKNIENLPVIQRAKIDAPYLFHAADGKLIIKDTSLEDNRFNQLTPMIEDKYFAAQLVDGKLTEEDQKIWGLMQEKGIPREQAETLYKQDVLNYRIQEKQATRRAEENANWKPEKYFQGSAVQAADYAKSGTASVEHSESIYNLFRDDKVKRYDEQLKDLDAENARLTDTAGMIKEGGKPSAGLKNVSEEDQQVIQFIVNSKDANEYKALESEEPLFWYASKTGKTVDWQLGKEVTPATRKEMTDKGMIPMTWGSWIALRKKANEKKISDLRTKKNIRNSDFSDIMKSYEAVKEKMFQDEKDGKIEMPPTLKAFFQETDEDKKSVYLLKYLADQ